MLYIALSLLSGWILSLFGFDAVVIQGVFELFGKTITSTSYYFLFGVLGALNLFSASGKTTIPANIKELINKK